MEQTMKKALVLHHRDGSSRIACIVPIDFPVQAWVMARLQSFNLLGVTHIEEQVLNGDEQHVGSRAK